jgi:hypothetical protein
MVVGKNEVCVLWIKKEGHFFEVSELPNDGVKNIILSEAIKRQWYLITLIPYDS